MLMLTGAATWIAVGRNESTHYSHAVPGAFCAHKRRA